ncbi:hypothetical protein BG418_07925 [Streptomyces sp. CBMA152]|nr:hypothetical protein [Streptomyces sp. CBMA152]
MVGRSLTAVLLSTAVAWGTPVATAGAVGPVAAVASTSPVKAVASTYITLDPTQGAAGSRVGVHGYGFDNCHTYPSYPSYPSPSVVGPSSSASPSPSAEPTPGPIDVTWGNGGNPSVVTADAQGAFETDVTAPSDATPGTYDETARCTVDSKLKATAQFTVTAKSGPATLALDPGEGPVQTSVTVTGSGFENCPANGASGGGQPGTVTLTWDGSPLAVDPPTELTVADGSFTAKASVPSDADPTADHTVRAVCAGYPELAAEAHFKVTSPSPQPSPPTPPPTPLGPSPTSNPHLTLDPTSLSTSGGSVEASGSGFNCPQVELSGDGQAVETVDTAADGTFDAQLSVQADSAEGRHTVRAQCATQTDVADEAVFTVTGDGPVPSPPTPNPTTIVPNPTPNPSPGLDNAVPVGMVVGSSLFGVALLAAVGSAFFIRHHRSRGWAQGHIRCRLRPTTAPTTEVAEPPDSGPPTHSVRLEPHADPGDQTVEEDP